MQEVRGMYLFVIVDRYGMPSYCQVVKELTDSEVAGAVRLYANQRVFNKASLTVQVYGHSGEQFFTFGLIPLISLAIRFLVVSL